MHFFWQTLSNWKFSLGCFWEESHEILTNIGFKICLVKERREFFFCTIYVWSQERAPKRDLATNIWIVKKSNMAKICQKLLPHLSQSCLNWAEPYHKICLATDVLISVTNNKNCWKTQSCKPVGLTRFWGSVKHVYIVHVLARVLYTRASTCVCARALIH